MLVCFRCSPRTKEQLDALVASGSYPDHGDVIAAAVANLLLLEREFAAKGQVAFDPHPTNGTTKPEASQQTAVLLQQVAVEEEEFDAPPKSGNGVPVKKRSRKAEVPPIFQLEGMPHTEPRGLVDVPPDMWHHGQDVPLDRWILGQFNRLLPAKANCRAVVHLFQKKGALAIDVAAEEVAKEALTLREFLATLDAEHKVQRDDALATAFPQRKKDSQKAVTRYANQFVVYQNSRGELSGLMIDMKLISVDNRRRQRRIVPTHMAWEFAKLENPILDCAVNGVVQKFSDDEKELLIEHILRRVPVESFAYRAILRAVVDGHNTPEKIDSCLQKHVARDRAEALSQSFLASQRSGAISRMSDLGLIARQRDGIRVSYEVPKDGHQFMERYDRLVQPIEATMNHN